MVFEPLKAGRWMAVATIAAVGLATGWHHASAEAQGAKAAQPPAIKVAEQRLKGGAQGSVELALKLPAGTHLNPDAPVSYTVTTTGTAVSVAKDKATWTGTAPKLPMRIPYRAGVGRGTMCVDLSFYYCREDGKGACLMKTVRWEVPVVSTRGGALRFRLDATAAPIPPH